MAPDHRGVLCQHPLERFDGPFGSPLLGEPEHPDYFSRRFKNLVTAADDVPLIRLNDLRHTNATLSLKAGVHPKVISERLGHASIAITLDLYSHVTPGISREAADAVESMVYD